MTQRNDARGCHRRPSPIRSPAVKKHVDDEDDDMGDEYKIRKAKDEDDMPSITWSNTDQRSRASAMLGVDIAEVY